MRENFRLLRYLLLFLAIIFASNIYAQTKTVTGKVTDATGNPIGGASIIIKGKNSGTTSDANGNFSIAVNPGDVLTVSGVSYERTDIKITQSNTYAVSLKSNESVLGEIIVTGVAGATSRAKMTVSVTKVTAEKLNAVPPTSLSSALTGKVAGLKASSIGGMPGESLDIQLRADNNLNVSASPLILIDGIIMTGNLADINSDDVESIEVVKGAAASALYGSRAGNGVISIITKRGKGIASNKPVITVRNEYGIQQLANELKVANAHPYSMASDWEQYKGRYTKYAGVTYPSDYSGGGFNTGISGDRQIDADHYVDNPYGVYRNQQKEFFVTGHNLTNFVSIANRTEKNNIYASIENNAQRGVIALTNGYKRQNFRFNLDQELAPWLRFSMSNLYILRSVQYPGTNNSGDGLSPANAGGIFYAIARQERDIDLGGLNPDGQPYYLRSNQFNQEATNPLYDLYKRKRDEKTSRWLGNFALNLKLTKWANVDVSHSIEMENYKYTIITPKDFWTQSGGPASNNFMSYTNGSMSVANNKTLNQNTQVTLNLAKEFGDLSVKAKLSYLYENRKYETNYMAGNSFKYPGIENMNNFETQNLSVSSSTETEKALNYFAILGLDYKGKFLLDGMFRYDGSSLFGPDSRWNPYYRISGAYRLSQDLHIPGIDELKLRAARGISGIRPGFDWQYEVYSLDNGNTAPIQVGNTFLKPSKTTETEFGLNVEFLKKFTLEVVYANSTTEDQFLNAKRITFLTYGFPRQYINAGTIKSKTYEATFGANWIRSKDFSWNTNIVFSRTEQKITSLPIPPYLLSAQGLGDQNMIWVKEGESYGAMYGYQFVRTLEQMKTQLPSGKSIDDYEVNSDGYVVPKGSQGTPNELPVRLKENGADLYGKIGDGNPKFIMGISNTLSYKNFTFYFLLDWKNGGDIYNGKDQRLAFNYVSKRMDMTNVAPEKKKAYDYWATGMYDKNDANKYWVEDGSYLKLREVALGYNIPRKALNHLFNGKSVFKGANVRVVGRNLLTFTNYSGYDPEIGSIRVPYDGIYANPNYRNYSFSLTLEF